MAFENISLKLTPWILLTTFMVLWYSFSVFLIVLLIRRRNHPYLRARSSNLIAVCVFGSSFSLISPTLKVLVDYHYPCWMTHWGASIAGITVLLPDIFRCVRLLAMDRIRSGKILLAGDNNEHLSEEKRSRILKRIKLFKKISKTKTLIFSYPILFAIHMVILGIFVAIDESERSMYACEKNLTTVHAGIVLITYCGVLLVLSACIYRIREEFNIKRGIWITVGVVSLTVLLHVITVTAIPRSAHQYFPETLPYHIGVVLDVTNVAVMPLIKSYSNKYQTLELMEMGHVEGDPSQELDKVLQRDSTRKILQDYCEREFSTENYYFWVDESRFKEAPNDKERMKLAEDIISKYLAYDCSIGLNISSDSQSEILEKWEKTKSSGTIDPEFFESISVQVLSNLLDTFLRLRSTEQWTSYQESISHELDAYGDLIAPDLKNEDKEKEKEKEKEIEMELEKEKEEKND